MAVLRSFLSVIDRYHALDLHTIKRIIIIYVVAIMSIKFTQNKIVQAITFTLMSSPITQITWAEDVNQLAVITLTAENSSIYAGGNLNQTIDLGILGNKEILDVPFNVTAYSEKIMQEQQAFTIGEVLKNDPSIRMVTNSGHLDESFQLRGFSLGSDEIAYNGMYGVAPISRVPVEMISGINVVKGPNALISGMAPNGGVGGNINVIPKRAEKNLTQLTSTYDDGGYFQNHLDVARRFGENEQFGIRTNLVYGQGEHNIEGQDDRKAIASIAADYQTDQLKISLDAYSIQEKRKHGSPAMVSFEKLDQLIAAPKGDTNYFDSLNAQIESNFISIGAQYQYSDHIDAFASVGYAEKKYKGFLFGTRLILQNKQGDAQTQSYSTAAKYNNWTANAGMNFKFDTGVLKHQLGLRGDYLKIQFDQHGLPPSSPYETNLYHPTHASQMPEAAQLYPYGDNTFTSFTVSDQISMLDDKLQVIAGLRYQDMNIKSLFSMPPFIQATKYSDDQWSPSLGIVLKPLGENISFYANYVEGLTQGATVSEINDRNYGQTFAPFQTRQYEIGAKVQTGSWLNTLALYQIKKPTTMVRPYADANDPNITQITNDHAQQKSKGVEWAVSGEVFNGLDVMGSVAYQNVKFDKANEYQGNKIVGVPDVTASFRVNYAVPLIAGFSVNTQLTHIGKQYLNQRNSIALPSYTIVDAGARFNTIMGNVPTTLSFNIDNLSNKKYWQGAFTENYAIIGADRTYKVGISFDF